MFWNFTNWRYGMFLCIKRFWCRFRLPELKTNIISPQFGLLPTSSLSWSLPLAWNFRSEILSFIASKARSAPYKWSQAYLRTFPALQCYSTANCSKKLLFYVCQMYFVTTKVPLYYRNSRLSRISELPTIPPT